MVMLDEGDTVRPGEPGLVTPPDITTCVEGNHWLPSCSIPLGFTKMFGDTAVRFVTMIMIGGSTPPVRLPAAERFCEPLPHVPIATVLDV